MAAKMRADRLLVARGLFESRAKARAAIEAGLVTANAVQVRKPSDEIADDARIDASPAFPYVSRGGVKLAHALDTFDFSPANRACLDVGASTGGFTEVLVMRDATRVYAVDVASAQLHARLRAEPRVVSIEQQDIRTLNAARLDPRPRALVIDVSFVSLAAVLPASVAALDPSAGDAWLVALVKPQFEVGRAHVRKGGVVRDAEQQQAACARIAECVRGLGWTVRDAIPSPIHGGDGNAEFLLGATRG